MSVVDIHYRQADDTGLELQFQDVPSGMNCQK